MSSGKRLDRPEELLIIARQVYPPDTAQMDQLSPPDGTQTLDGMAERGTSAISGVVA
jgi:hypothetical protein